MEELKKAVDQLKQIREEISTRQEKWKQVKPDIQDHLKDLAEKSELDFEVIVTDHIENWESVSLKLKSSVFSYYTKGNKKQMILKEGGYLVYGLMPSGFIKAGMIFPRIDDIKEKELTFLQFELLKDPSKLSKKKILSHLTRFIKEIAQWELGEGGEIKERIGFKLVK